MFLQLLPPVVTLLHGNIILLFFSFFFKKMLKDVERLENLTCKSRCSKPECK